MLEKLGEGAFGEVSKGFLDEQRKAPGYNVAVKVLKGKSDAALQDFMGEVALMSNLQHKNVLNLVGVVTRGEPRMMIVPFCGNGDLKGFLKRMATALNRKVQLGICRDISAGMAYLARRSLVHRDLAARNVLVADDFGCKISDFGMARELEGVAKDGDYYRAHRGAAIPVRWTAVEALEENKYTEKSDVWSFGVTCYEVFTAAETPYAGMSNQVVLLRVKDGYRLPCPPRCPRGIYTTYIRPCWEALPKDRPTFAMLEAGLSVIGGTRRGLAKAVSSHLVSDNNEREHGATKSKSGVRSSIGTGTTGNGTNDGGDNSSSSSGEESNYMNANQALDTEAAATTATAGDEDLKEQSVTTAESADTAAATGHDAILSSSMEDAKGIHAASDEADGVIEIHAMENMYDYGDGSHERVDVDAPERERDNNNNNDNTSRDGGELPPQLDDYAEPEMLAVARQKRASQARFERLSAFVSETGFGANAGADNTRDAANNMAAGDVGLENCMEESEEEDELPPLPSDNSTVPDRGVEDGDVTRGERGSYMLVVGSEGLFESQEK